MARRWSPSASWTVSARSRWRPWAAPWWPGCARAKASRRRRCASPRASRSPSSPRRPTTRATCAATRWSPSCARATPTGLAAARRTWRRRGHRVRSVTVGSIFGLGGRVLDNRRVLVLLDGPGDESWAERAATRWRGSRVRRRRSTRRCAADPRARWRSSMATARPWRWRAPWCGWAPRARARTSWSSRWSSASATSGTAARTGATRARSTWWSIPRASRWSTSCRWRPCSGAWSPRRPTPRRPRRRSRPRPSPRAARSSRRSAPATSPIRRCCAPPSTARSTRGARRRWRRRTWRWRRRRARCWSTTRATW